MVEPFSCVVDLARPKEELSEDSTGLLLEVPPSRALLGTASHLCNVLVLKLRTYTRQRMLAFVDSAGGQYLAVEGLTPHHLVPLHPKPLLLLYYSQA